MRKSVLLAAVLLTAGLALTACNKQEAADQAGAAPATVQATRPADPNDQQAWNKYFGQLVQANLQGMKAQQPYPYLVPAGDSEEVVAQRGRQLDGVHDTVLRGVLPGNLLAFAGRDSATTAQFIADAFKDAQAGSFKDVIIVFIGEQADEAKVDEVLKPTGATVRFVQM